MLYEVITQAAFKDQYRRVTLQVVTVDTGEEAAAILDEARGGADMAVLARERSHDPYAGRNNFV